jgi:inner membrane protein YidH
MACLRTAMASDRTLLAWVRTALSMVSFGFTIYKFFQYLYESRPEMAVPHGARSFALMLTGVALLGLVAGLLEHRHVLKQLGGHPARSFWSSFSVMTALAVGAIAGLVFVSALWRGPL